MGPIRLVIAQRFILCTIRTLTLIHRLQSLASAGKRHISLGLDQFVALGAQGSDRAHLEPTNLAALSGGRLLSLGSRALHGDMGLEELSLGWLPLHVAAQP